MTDSRVQSVRTALRRPAVGVLVLLAIYAGLSLLMDRGGYLGTDTGAKVATLDHMVENDTFSPVVGYWAEEWDPDGDYHPLFDSRLNSDGEWINVTTLPMLYAAHPLYDVGGYRLSLLWPMLGAVAAAFASRDLARQLGDEEAGFRAFWIVALASPMAVYALDLWEHSIGAACMVGATSFLMRSVGGDARARWPLLAGLAFGVSSTMRTETFVVTLVVVAVACLWLLRSSAVAAVRTGVVTMLGFAGPWFANRLLEDGLGGNDRSERVAGAAQREFWTELGDRLDESFITWFGLPGLGYPEGPLAGLTVVVLVLGAVLLQRRGQERGARYAIVGAGLVYVLALLGAGPAFVSGALVASPVAVAAFWRPRPTNPALVVLVMALSATAVTWMFQYLGGAGPQWGGRYILAPTLLLTTLGAVHLADVPAFIGRTVVAFGVGVTAFGVVWLGVRSHDVDEFFDTLTVQPEDVVISTNGFLVREAGPAYEDRLYLSLGRGTDLEGAVEVVREAGFTTFAVLVPGTEVPEVDAVETGRQELDFLGVDHQYVSYRLDGS